MSVSWGLHRSKPVLGKAAMPRRERGSFYSDAGAVVHVPALVQCYPIT